MLTVRSRIRVAIASCLITSIIIGLAMVLYHLGPRYAPNFTAAYSPWLVPVLKVQALSGHTSVAAEQRLRAWGRAILPELEEVSRTNDDGDVRWLATSMLSEAYDGTQQNIREVLSYLAKNDPDYRVRASAIKSLAIGGKEDVMRRMLLSIYLFDDNEVVVFWARLAALERGCSEEFIKGAEHIRSVMWTHDVSADSP